MGFNEQPSTVSYLDSHIDTMLKAPELTGIRTWYEGQLANLGEITKAGFSVQVLFPDELDKILTGKIEGNAAKSYKKVLLSFFKGIYSFGIGKTFIKWIYPFSLYLIGSHSIIFCEKRK